MIPVFGDYIYHCLRDGEGVRQRELRITHVGAAKMFVDAKNSLVTSTAKLKAFFSFKVHWGK